MFSVCLPLYSLRNLVVHNLCHFFGSEKHEPVKVLYYGGLMGKPMPTRKAFANVRTTVILTARSAIITHMVSV